MGLIQRIWAAVGHQTTAYLTSLACGAVPALAAFLCLLPLRRRRLAGRGLYSSPGREASLD